MLVGMAMADPTTAATWPRTTTRQHRRCGHSLNPHGAGPPAQCRQRSLSNRAPATRLVDVRITDSARKHGVTDTDMLHAFAVAVRSIPGEDDTHLLIGADWSGRFLELIYIDDEDPRIIHAMPLRQRFYRYLPR